MDEFLLELKTCEMLISLGEPREALKRLIKLTQTYPENYQVASMMGELYLSMGAPHKAIRPLKWATKQYLKEKGFQGNLVKTDDELAFIAELKKKSKEKNENLLWHLWVNHFLLGCAYTKCQKFKTALRHLNLADIMNPNNGEILRNIGWALVMSGRVINGRALLMRAVALEPENAYALNDLAASYLYEQNYMEAKQWIEKALELDPYDPLIRETADQIDELKAYQKLFTTVRKQ